MASESEAAYISDLEASNLAFQSDYNELQAENNKMTDMLMAAGFLGQGTQLIGDKRYEELLKAEARNESLFTKVNQLKTAIGDAIVQMDEEPAKEILKKVMGVEQ